MTTTTLNRDAELSTLSNAAYLDNPPLQIGNWTRVGEPRSTASGFFGVAYMNAVTKQVVVSYRGTDNLLSGDAAADAAFGTGSWNQQFQDAAAFTASVPVAPASNYRTLRDTDNVYWVNSYQTASNACTWREVA